MSALQQPVNTPVPVRWRLRPAVRKSVVVVHILSSVALLGEVWGLVVLNLSATLTDEAVLANSAYRLMERLVFAGGIPLSLSALASGIVLALSSRWGLTAHYWVFAKLLLLIGVICVGMFLFDPGGMAAEGGAPSSGRQWAQVAAVSTQVAMLVTTTWLSVFKPRRRAPWARAARP